MALPFWLQRVRDLGKNPSNARDAVQSFYGGGKTTPKPKAPAKKPTPVTNPKPFILQKNAEKTPKPYEQQVVDKLKTPPKSRPATAEDLAGLRINPLGGFSPIGDAGSGTGGTGSGDPARDAAAQELANKKAQRKLDEDFIKRAFGVTIAGLDDYYQGVDTAIEIAQMQLDEQYDVAYEQLMEDYNRNVAEFATDLTLAQEKLNKQFERASGDVKRQHAQTVQDINLSLQSTLEARSRAERATASQSSAQLGQAGLADSGLADVLTPHYDRLFGQTKRDTALEAQKRGIGRAGQAKDITLERYDEDLRTQTSELELQNERNVATLERNKARRQEELGSQHYYGQQGIGARRKQRTADYDSDVYDAELTKLSGLLGLATDAGDLTTVKRYQDQIIGLGARPNYRPELTSPFRGVVQDSDRETKYGQKYFSNTATTNTLGF